MSEVKFDFHNKNFIVVGASSGMGRQIAFELAQAGAHVLAIGRNEYRLKDLKNDFPDLISTAIMDVRSITNDELSFVIDDFVVDFGKINGLVYTAGIAAGTPLRGYDESLAREIMDTGFWGAMKFMQIATKKKYANRASSYVLFSSTAGYTGEKGLSIYSATKASIRIATRSLAHDLVKNGHRINSISPGYVNTRMTQLSVSDMGEPVEVIGRHLLGIGEPEDVSGMVLFLLSDRAKWITGKDIIVDGGYMNRA